MQETAEQYKKRMFDFMAGRDPLKLQAAAPARLAKLLKGVSPAKARKRPAPDKWSIAEIVAHIADTELVGGYRIRAILGQPGTPIIGFDQDAWVTALHYDKRDLKKSFEQYRALREANLALLKSLTPEQWKHEGMHSERGRGERRDDCANVLGSRPEPFRADRAHSGREEEVARPFVQRTALSSGCQSSRTRQVTVVVGWSPNSAANRVGSDHFGIRAQPHAFANIGMFESGPSTRN